jgi:hypothetical protein
MASLRGSRPTHPLLGLGLVSLLAGIFYVGATLPCSERIHPAEEQPPALESPVQSFRGAETDDLDALDAEGVQSNTGARPGEDAALQELLRIIEEDPDRFPICYAVLPTWPSRPPVTTEAAAR